MTNHQNLHILVSRVQGNNQNKSVIDVEECTSVATHLLRNITPNQFEVNIYIFEDYFIHCIEHMEIYLVIEVPQFITSIIIKTHGRVSAAKKAV